MSIYSIADLHLSLGTDKPMDVFEGWEGYTEKLEENWNRKIKDEDTVVIVGDISWAFSLKDSIKDFTFINNELRGKKVIIRGNHDYWWGTKRKVEMFLKENNFNSISIIHNSIKKIDNCAICGTRGWIINKDASLKDKKILKREIARLKTSVDLAVKEDLKPIVFLHFPPIYRSEVCEEIIDILTKNNIKNCYYGHIHNNKSSFKSSFKYKNIEFRIVSADILKFDPIRIKC